MRSRSTLVKFLVLVIPGMVAAACLVLGYFEWTFLKEADQETRTKLERFTRSYSAVVAPLLWNIDTQGVDAVLEAMAAEPDFGRVVVRGEKGVPFAEHTVPGFEPGRLSETARIVFHTEIEGVNRDIGSMTVWFSDHHAREEALDRFFLAGALVLGLVLVIIGTSLLAFQWIVGTPLKHLLGMIQAAEKGERGTAMAWRSDDEIGMVIDAFNRMLAAREETEQQLLQAQKMEAVGQLTGGIAHDFNNLLMIVSGNLEMLESHVEGNAKAEKFVRTARRATTRGADLTRRLLAFSRRQALAPRDLEPAGLIHGMEDMLRRSLGEAVDLRTNVPPDLWAVTIDPGQLETAMVNLAINARDAMPGGGILTIVGANAVLDTGYLANTPDVLAGDYVALSVSDNGTGMAPDVLERVFEPFFTTKDKSKGSGLGLSMVFGFIKQSNGHIRIYSEPGQGTTVSLYLPRAQGSAAGAEVHGGPSGAETGTEAILLVEDDTDVRQVTARFLADAGYRIAAEAGDAAEALEKLDDADEVDLLFTDVVLPGGMDGAELAAEVERRRPGIRVLYTSGYSESAVVHTGRLDAGVQMISKPYSGRELLRKVREVLDSDVSADVP